MQMETLHYLLAIEKYGSTRKAAEERNTSHQNVSRSLQAMENELGVTLFLRTSKGLIPTKHGQFAITTAKSILALYDTMVAQFSGQSKNAQTLCKEAVAGKLNLTSSMITSNGFLNDFLVEFSAQYPNIEINLMEEDAYQSSKNTSCRLYILPRTAAELAHTKESIFPLLEDNIVLLAKKDSPFANQKSISLKRLVQLPLVLTAKKDWGSSFFGHILNMYQVQPEKPVYTNSIFGIQKYVASGNYVGLSTNILSSKLISDRKNLFTKIPIRDKNIEIYHCLVIKDRDHLTPVEETFVQAIKESFHFLK